MGNYNKLNTNTGIPNSVTHNAGEPRRSHADENEDKDLMTFNNSTRGGLLRIDGSSLNQDVN